MNFLGCAAVVALAQQNPQKQPEIQQSPSMVLKVTTHLVIVDAVVTDSSGAPVRDLTKEDFKLYEDGRPQEIQHFSFQEATRIAPSRPVERNVPKNVITNIPESSEAGPVTVVLIDALNTPTADRVYLQRQLMKYLQRETVTGPVAIYMLSNRLHRLQDFTTDRELLKDVVKRFSLETSALTNEHPTDSVNDTLVRELGNTNLKDMDRQMLRALQEMVDDKMAAETDMRAAITLDALRRIAGYLGGYPGRKNLIWVSEAFPLVVTSEVRNRVASSYTNRMRETANVLTDARVAIYPVDVRGLVTDMPDITLEGRTNNPIKLNASVDQAHDSMDMLAEQTGGRAFYNRNDIDEAVAQSIEDGATYYTMGYYPTTDNWDGGFRKIEVRLQRDGLHVRNRKGYFAIDQETAARAQQNSGRQELLDALSPGSPNITSLPFTVQLDPPARGAQEVLIEFHVDPRQVAFKKQSNNTQHAEIHFVVRAFDPGGKLVESDSKVVQMDLKAQTFAEILHSGSLGFNQKIKLPPGDYLLKVGLRDVRSNLMGTISARISVPK